VPEALEPANRFRGMFRLDIDRCIKCALRHDAIDIIYIDWHQSQRGDRQKEALDRFDRRAALLFCGLCESVPTEPVDLVTTQTYEARHPTWQTSTSTCENRGLEGAPQYTDQEIAWWSSGRRRPSSSSSSQRSQ
jgi:formate hydrogenlyase subunit 6/NADH:ubiquinone oxidoreductase subunit I